MQPLDLLVEQTRARAHAPVEFDSPVEVAALPTPALVLNRAAMRRNIERMSAHVAEHGKGFRPHAKTHKCPLICKAQLEHGAVGVCVAKLGEALALASAGIDEILVTSPITTDTKAAVLPKILACDVHLQLVVDSDTGLEVLDSGLPGESSVGVLIDVDVAMGRTGTRDVQRMLRLIERIDADPRMQFGGIQHYAGHVMHIAGHAERRSASLELWESVENTVQKLAQEGAVAQVVTGGGTGTYDIDIEVASLTDLQVGSFVVMDEEYRLIGSRTQDRFEDFDVSLTLACTTISQPTERAMTVDAGYKALASDTVAPVTDELADTKFRFAGDEHGVLIFKAGQQAVQLGQVLQLVTPHCDPTVNLHDYYYVQDDDGLIREAWPITARGCTW